MKRYNSFGVETPDGEYVKYEDVREILIEFSLEYDNPMTYQDRDYYVRCDAKVDVIDDIMNRVEYKE